jgi:hypothetical protein
MKFNYSLIIASLFSLSPLNGMEMIKQVSARQHIYKLISADGHEMVINEKLLALSQPLKTMFTGSFKETQEKKAFIPLNAPELELLLGMMYHITCIQDEKALEKALTACIASADTTNLFEVLDAAQEWQLPEVIQRSLGSYILNEILLDEDQLAQFKTIISRDDQLKLLRQLKLNLKNCIPALQLFDSTCDLKKEADVNANFNLMCELRQFILGNIHALLLRYKPIELAKLLEKSGLDFKDGLHKENDVKTLWNYEPVFGENYYPTAITMLDNATIVAGYKYGMIAVRDRFGNEISRFFTPERTCVAKIIQLDAQHIGVWADDGKLHIFDWKTSQQKSKIPGYKNKIHTLCRTLGEQHKIFIWDISSGLSIQEINDPRMNCDSELIVLNYSEYITADGEKIHLWKNNRIDQVIPAPHYWGCHIYALAHHQGKIATGCANGTIYIRSLAEPKKITHTFHHKEGKSIFCLTFLNERYLASCGEDKMVRIWDLKENKELLNLKVGYSYCIWAKQSKLILGCSDGQIKELFIPQLANVQELLEELDRNSPLNYLRMPDQMIRMGLMSKCIKRLDVQKLITALKK